MVVEVSRAAPGMESKPSVMVSRSTMGVAVVGQVLGLAGSVRRRMPTLPAAALRTTCSRALAWLSETAVVCPSTVEPVR
jgi:hypothetical protein